MRIERIRELDVELISYLFQTAGMEISAANGRFFQSEDNILLVAEEAGTPAGFCTPTSWRLPCGEAEDVPVFH